jgi:uncharacterized protein (DUF1697 family)
MVVLRQVFELLGFSGVATFIASGNVAFGTRANNVRMLERKIEKDFGRPCGMTWPCSYGRMQS